MCCEQTLVVPFFELLQECFVFCIVEQELFARSGCVWCAKLFAHCDEPVGFGVVSKRNAVRIDFLDLSANVFQRCVATCWAVRVAPPVCRKFEAVVCEECLVVVQNFGRLTEWHCVHEAITKCATFVVETWDEVSLLSVCQTDDFLCTISVCNFYFAVDKVVQCCYRFSNVVKCNVVWVAVSNVWATANCQLFLDLVTNIVVTTNLFMIYCDIGIKLVKLCNVFFQNCTEVCTHCVVESDSYRLTIVAFCWNNKVISYKTTILAHWRFIKIMSSSWNFNVSCVIAT